MPLNDKAREEQIKKERLGTQLLELLNRSKEGRELIERAQDSELSNMVLLPRVLRPKSTL